MQEFDDGWSKGRWLSGHDALKIFCLAPENQVRGVQTAAARSCSMRQLQPLAAVL